MLSSYYEQDGITIYHGRCEDVLPQLKSFDLLMTDPPYGINACNQTLGKGKKKFKRGDWDRTRPEGMAEIVATAKFACVWGGNYFADVLPVNNDWLVWHKANDGRTFSEVELAWTNYGKQTRHKTHNWGGEQKRHPTQKPLAVIKWAIGLAPESVESIVDPFMGSGTTLLAAKLAGITAVGIEIEETYCEIAANRLRQGMLPFAR